jgi:hypothetical protein
MSFVDLINQSEVLIVFKWWACWQIFDFTLTKLKIKLRKPWILDQKNPEKPLKIAA